MPRINVGALMLYLLNPSTRNAHSL